MNKGDIAELKEDICFDYYFDGRELVFYSTWGLFSPRDIDSGTRLILKYLEGEVAEDDVSLDLGCGYGPIGMALAHMSPEGEIHMVDKDFLAVEYANKNAKANGFDNCKAYLSNGFSAIPEDVVFDNVISNIPAKVGAELLTIFLEDAKSRLKPGGKIYVIVVNGLKDFIKRNFKEVFGNYKKLKQGKTHTVAMAIKE
ncbi:methyltransferase [Candidatus Peregrinibacteria bacterium]|jgi:16S rRNA (guanine1207-N2)-methyltransferase|nr:methyltransferase [Candidatus Peregrinibacteria bacterium]